MRIHSVRVKQTIILLSVSLCFLAILLTPAAAQRSSRSSPMERRSEELNRRREQLEREMLLRGVEPKSENAESRPAAATVSRVKQDFERIQAIYNELVRALASSKPLDYGFVYAAATEIKRCSSRLKSNLMLPSNEEEAKGQKQQEGAGNDDIQRTVLLLTQRIRSFVTNPIFEATGTIDIKLSATASQDLRKIIELSEEIRKRADKLNKPGT